MSAEDFADSLRTEARDATDTLDPADLMRHAEAEERDELATRVEGHATGLGQEFGTVREARICDCLDDLHTYAPTTDDWEWMPVAEAEYVRLYQAGTHMRYRTTVTVWIGAGA